MRLIQIFLSILFIQLTITTFAQRDREREQATVDYASKENPYYWKNRLPYAGYWQQDVHYRIKANISEVSDVVDATEQLTYTNNSPDTLRWVFFHLYQNAFQPGSYCAALHEANDYPLVWGPYEKLGLGTLVESMKSKGEDLKTELDNTILKVWLLEPLLPGAQVTFDIAFKTFFDYRGNVRRRMKEFGAYGFKHFDGVHWYPRMAVYDKKFGWNTDQHLGKEFYGDFGTYEVELNFASNYVVEATGVLLNRDEVLPAELRAKLDISNFASKPWEERPSTITTYDPKERKTWKYRAINVHDFAWTADPTYRIGEAEWNGIQIVAVVQEPHAARWQNAASYTAKIIETYSRDFGMYAYNKMVVADAQDGMEYPMLTLDGGADPGYRGLLAHEVGHNWFFGMVGSNETYRAFLDEGFTQFLTAWALENIDGPMVAKGSSNKYTAKHQLPEQIRYARAYQGYIRDAVNEDETTLNTHSDDFDGALRHGGGYGNVYYKTATMLYNLQYVLGDSLFLEAMQFYFDRWKIAHPYPEDFRAAIIDYTHADLNWFFDQWLETSKTIDYRIKKVKHKGEGKYAITLRRDGEMHMPIDLAVYDQSGTRYDYYIPNTWFVKNTTATVLPRWIGWGKLQPEYTAEIQLNNRIDNVVIDTTYRLADVRQFNNRMQKRGTLRLDSRVANPSDWKHYEFFIRPDLWYNHYDGLKTGFHVNGNYMRTLHRFEASFWLNSGLVRLRNGPEDQFNDYNLFSFALNYRTPTQKIVKNSSLLAEGRYLDGLRLGKLGWEVASRKGNTVFSLYLKYMERRDTTDVNYLMDRSVWNPNAINHTLNAGLQHTYEYMRGTGKIQLLLRTSAPGSVYDFSQAILESVNENYVGKLQIRTRFFAQYGTGSKLAPESALYLAGANPEQLMENKFTRSAAFFPQDFNGLGADVNHFHMGGGLNVRGYAGYLAPEQLANGDVILLNSGSSGAAGSVELEFDNLVKFKPRITRNWLKLDLYLFGDAGILDSGIKGDKPQFERIRISSGFGTAWTIKRWGPFAMEKPLTLRFDMPLFLNRTPDVSPDYLQFRWVVGVNRAF